MLDLPRADRQSAFRFAGESPALLSERIPVDEQVNRDADARNSNCKTNNDDDGLELAGLFSNPRGLLFLGIQEAGEFIFERGGDGFLVFKLEREPFAFGGFPFLRQVRQDFRIRGLKSPSRPKRRSFLRPNPKAAVIGGKRLEALPKQLPRGVGD